MPPHLHPRSRSTATLFTTCLTVSFLVVGLPHILPCPVDRRRLSDSGEVRPKRRRRKEAAEAETQVDGTEPKSLPVTAMARREDGTGTADVSSSARQDSEAGLQRRARECPVPKPKGILGQIMGFGSEDRSTEVIVRPLRNRRIERDQSEN